MRGLVACLLLFGGCAHEKQAWPTTRASSGEPTSSAAVSDEEPAETREPAPAAESATCRWPTEPVTMDLVREDVRRVLQALADRGGINLVLADEVGGRVTVRLDRVPLGEALVTIARAAGLELETDRCVTTVH